MYTVTMNGNVLDSNNRNKRWKEIAVESKSSVWQYLHEGRPSSEGEHKQKLVT